MVFYESMGGKLQKRRWEKLKYEVERNRGNKSAEKSIGRTARGIVGNIEKNEEKSDEKRFSRKKA